MAARKEKGRQTFLLPTGYLRRASVILAQRPDKKS